MVETWGRVLGVLTISGSVVGLMAILCSRLIGVHLKAKAHYVILLFGVLSFVIPYGYLTKVDISMRKNDITLTKYMQSANMKQDTEDKTGTKMTFTDNKSTKKQEKEHNQPEVKQELANPLTLSSRNHEWLWEWFKQRTSTSYKGLFYIWGIGAIFYLVLQGIQYKRYRAYLLETSERLEKNEKNQHIYEYVKKSAPAIKIFTSEGIQSPMLIGTLKPKLFLNKVNLNSPKIKWILDHELAHFHHKDLWLKWGLLLIRSIHWFNPVIYILCSTLEEVCEERCDERVTSYMNAQEKKAYGLVILDAIQMQQNEEMRLSSAMAGDKKMIKRRLMRLKKSYISRKWKGAMIGLLIATFSIMSLNVSVKAANGVKQFNTITRPIAVAKADGIYLVDLTILKETKVIEGKAIQNMKISPDGNKIAYLEDHLLSIAKIEKPYGKKVEESVQIDGTVEDYIWKSNNEMIFAPLTGGIEGYNLNTGKKVTYISVDEKQQEKNIYSELTYDESRDILYANLTLRWYKDGEEYGRPQGIMSYNLSDDTTDVIMASVPISNQDFSGMSDSEALKNLGVAPSIAALSQDGKYLYIFKKYQAGSASADGIPLAIYDVEHKTLNELNQDEVFVLAKNDTLAINPIDSGEIVINNGGAREWFTNKTIGIIKDGKYANLLPQEQISVSGHYGEEPVQSDEAIVTSTPIFSADGTKIIYSGGKIGSYENWSKETYHLYSLDRKTQKITQLTSKDNVRDFRPHYLADGEGITFIRQIPQGEESNYQLILLKEGKETILSEQTTCDLDENSSVAY